MSRCPICDEKAMNCDCTRSELALLYECEEAYDRITEMGALISVLLEMMDECGAWAPDYTREDILAKANKRAGIL